jgi:hypothetical protein
MLYNSEGGSAKTNLCARNAPLLLDINFLGVKDESTTLAVYLAAAIRSFPSINGPFPQFRLNHAEGGQSDTEGGQVDEIACAAYRSLPPSNSLISLNLQKIAHFWIGN